MEKGLTENFKIIWRSCSYLLAFNLQCGHFIAYVKKGIGGFNYNEIKLTFQYNYRE